jgi:hypothetical protein
MKNLPQFNVIRTKSKEVAIPAGFRELVNGEVIERGDFYRKHETVVNDKYDNSTTIVYEGNWYRGNAKGHVRIATGEKYNNVNNHHFITIRPIKPKFDITGCWTAQIKVHSEKEWNEVTKKFIKLGLNHNEYYWDYNHNDGRAVVVSLKHMRIGYNYHQSFDDEQISIPFGYKIDMSTSIGKVHLNMLYELAYNIKHKIP